MSQYERKRRGKLSPPQEGEQRNNNQREEDEAQADEAALDALLDAAQLLRGHDDDIIDEADRDEPDLVREAADAQELDSLDDKFPELVITSQDVQTGKMAVEKVRLRHISLPLFSLDHIQILVLSNKVWNSPNIRAAMAEAASDANLNSEVLV